MDLSFDFSPGDLVAKRYRVVRPIGIGGSAQVYRAHRLDDDVEVALKVMHETDPSGVGRQRFEREAALVQRFRHPNVVGMHDFGHTDGGQPFIVFTLLRGRSLKGAIKKEGALGAERAGRITLDVLGALIEAHELGIIHRDIKPANIFLARESHGEAAQVLDFGLAKALFGDEQMLLETLTRTGYRLGTPRYMSPEMARGKPAGPPSDLYGLGLVLAEMVSGNFVVEGSSQIEVLMAHASADPLDIAMEVRQSAFGAVIERSLAKDLDVRYRTAIQMRADVEAVLRGGTGAAAADLDATMLVPQQQVSFVPPAAAATPQPVVDEEPAPITQRLDDLATASAAPPPSSTIPITPDIAAQVARASAQPLSRALPSSSQIATTRMSSSNGKRIFTVLVFLLLAVVAAFAGYMLARG
jgi:serine/threonine protein kinase